MTRLRGREVDLRCAEQGLQGLRDLDVGERVRAYVARHGAMLGIGRFGCVPPRASSNPAGRWIGQADANPAARSAPISAIAFGAQRLEMSPERLAGEVEKLRTSRSAACRSSLVTSVRSCSSAQSPRANSGIIGRRDPGVELACGDRADRPTAVQPELSDAPRRS